MREEIGRDPLAGPLHVAGGEDAALGVDDVRCGDADPAGHAQEVLDDAYPFSACRAAAGEPGDGQAQFRIGGQLLRLVPSFHNPLLQRLDLGIEQGLQAGSADFPQRVADAPISPQADAEDGDEQQEQGEAGAVKGLIHVGRMITRYRFTFLRKKRATRRSPKLHLAQRG